MSTQDVMTKAYEEKINAQLQQTKAQLGEFEASARGKMAQTEIDTINQLKTRHQEIERKRQELKTAAGQKIDQVKAEIDAGLAKLKTSLSDLATRLRAKAS